MLKCLDLFSGIGGFARGFHRAGIETTQFCEIEPYARAVLAERFPGVPIHDDVRSLHATPGQFDIICGGFPCQDISSAGTGRGLHGERSGLWGEFRRIIKDCRPVWVVIENSPRLRSRGLEEVLGALTEIGYDAEWHCIPASAIGADHTRDRLWIIAHANTLYGPSWVGLFPDIEAEILTQYHRNRSGLWLGSSRPPPGVDDGLPTGMERRLRTECLGNAVVPQIPEIIGRALIEHHNSRVVR